MKDGLERKLHDQAAEGEGIVRIPAIETDRDFRRSEQGLDGGDIEPNGCVTEVPGEEVEADFRVGRPGGSVLGWVSFQEFLILAPIVVNQRMVGMVDARRPGEEAGGFPR